MDIWASKFLLPQHRHVVENDRGKPLPRPKLDEQRLEEMDAVLRQAVEQGSVVKVTAYDCWRPRQYIGRLRTQKGWIVIQTEMGIVRLPPVDVLGIE